MKMGKELNVVYVGNNSFPWGAATSKRRRYMVDYMNAHDIACHVLITLHGRQKEMISNGVYGKCDFHDLTYDFSFLKIWKYYNVGKKFLKEWYNPQKQNIFLYSTILELIDYPLYAYAKKLGYKIVFDQVEMSYLSDGASYSAKFWIRIKLNEIIRHYVYEHCDGSFVITQALYNQNRKEFANMPLCILPNSTPNLYNSEYVKSHRVPIVLYTGTFAPKDGVYYLIKGFLLARERGVNCKLIMTGKGKPKDLQILKLVAGNPNVEYRGLISEEELKNLLQESDILTMTRVNSKFANYGFPFKLSESLATGNPVIASNVSDVNLYVKHKENVYMVRPENIEDIANGIEFLVNNPQQAERIGKAGVDVVKTKFGLEPVGEIFTKFLKSL